MNPAEFRRGEQYIYTGRPEPEYVTFMYPEINHYDFVDADGQLIRISHPYASKLIHPIP